MLTRKPSVSRFAALACLGLVVTGFIGFTDTSSAQAAPPEAIQPPSPIGQPGVPLSMQRRPSTASPSFPGVPNTAGNYQQPAIAAGTPVPPGVSPDGAQLPNPAPAPVPVAEGDAVPAEITLPGQPSVPGVPGAPVVAAAPTPNLLEPDKVTLDDVRDKLVVTRDELWLFRDQMMYLELLAQYNNKVSAINGIQ